MVAAAIPFLGSVVIAYIGYAVGASLPMLIWLLWQDSLIHSVIAALICVFVIGTTAASYKLGTLQRRNITVVHELQSANQQLKHDRSRQQQTAQALSESESKLKEAAEIARLGHWRFDERNNKYISVSEEYARIFGYTAEQFLERYLNFEQDMALVHPDDKAAVLNAYQNAGPMDIDYRIIRADGELRYVREISRDVVTDGEGDVVETVGTLQDITQYKQVENALREQEALLEQRVDERTKALSATNDALLSEVNQHKLTEAALQESEARFRDYAETAADYFWEMGRDLRYTHFAGHYEEATGFPPDTFVGMTREEAWSIGVPEFRNSGSNVPALDLHESFRNAELEWQMPDGTRRVLSISGTAIFDGDGVFQGYRGTGRDITELHTLSTKLAYQASHDVLTDLINRREFELRLTRILETAQTDKSVHALCYLDLDKFKEINDSCGHAAGDELLRQLGALMHQQARARDTVARLGGDEFGILMEHCTLEAAERIAESIRKAIESYDFHWDGRRAQIGVSIGVVLISEKSRDVNSVMRDADASCYAAKNSGRNRVVLHHVG